MDQLSWTAHREMQASLKRELDVIAERHGLGAALEALKQHQIDSGFIRDRLDEVERFVFAAPEGPHRYFSAQYNPARARRFAGAGLALPPDGIRPVHDGCFLCADNIWWQQQGAEMGYETGLAGDRYTAWMNPFPLVPGHTVLATREHQPQGWNGCANAMLTLVDDLITLADLLPGWIGFYNGVGAGASIAGHLHFHFLPRPRHYGPLPLELAMRPDPGDGLIRQRYPLSFMHWSGSQAGVKAHMAPWLNAWMDGPGGQPDATANLIAIRGTGDDHGLDVYFIPRHQSRSRVEGLHGVVGGFEALGEIICSSPDDQRRLIDGEIDYEYIEGLLSHVSVAL